jgi:hypothetical protein
MPPLTQALDIALKRDIPFLLFQDILNVRQRSTVMPTTKAATSTKHASPPQPKVKAPVKEATKSPKGAKANAAANNGGQPKAATARPSAPAGNAAPQAQTVNAKKKKSDKREKVIRDSFTMPKHDFERIAQLKETCLKGGVVVKKSELLRAGLMALAALPDTKLLAVVAGVEAVKTGRPANG